jgi:excisionase family DNA binding protein
MCQNTYGFKAIFLGLAQLCERKVRDEVTCSGMRAESARRPVFWSLELMETLNPLPQTQPAEREHERLSYSIHEAAALLGVNYFSVYRLIQRGKLRACRALRGKLLVPRTELLRLLKS